VNALAQRSADRRAHRGIAPGGRPLSHPERDCCGGRWGEGVGLWGWRGAGFSRGFFLVFRGVRTLGASEGTMLGCEGAETRPAASALPIGKGAGKGARFTTPPSPSKSSRSSTPSPPRQDLLASVHGLHKRGIFDARQRLWTRSLALRRGGTVVVAEDYANEDPTADGQWCALDSINALLQHTPAT
jgi:hypothetical protein